jgi:hypothetical protein
MLLRGPILTCGLRSWLSSQHAHGNTGRLAASAESLQIRYRRVVGSTAYF